MTDSGRMIENGVQNISNGNRWLKWIVEYRFVFVVLSILIGNILYVIYSSLGFPGRDLFGSSTHILTLIFCIVAVSKDKRSLQIGLAGGGLSIITIWLSILFNLWSLAFVYHLFIFYTTQVIIYNVTISREININIIFGSIAGFLLIGVMGAVICSILEFLSPGSFALAEGMGNYPSTFFYFSIITMTSLGYGDITPATDIARMISAYLVLFGQLYLAIQVAILVGKFIKGSDITEKEIEELKTEIRSLKGGRKED